MTRVGLFGAGGRMGQAIAAAAADAGVAVAGHQDAAALARASDVLIDFSTPTALAGHLDAAVAAGTPIIVGTTGLDDDHRRALEAAARRVAVLQTANTSLGINLLAHLVEQAARRLGPDWDIEIVEMHHRHKVDAPSGTALLLGGAANRGRGQSDGRALNRLSLDGAREPGSVHFASLRGGSVAGDHMVVLAGEGERIELGHRAEGREIFARGAIKAAIWLEGKPPGRYSMTDVLGLE